MNEVINVIQPRKQKTPLYNNENEFGNELEIQII